MNRLTASIAATVASPPAAIYIAAQRGRLDAVAHPLASADQEALRTYFHPSDLRSVKVVESDPLPVAEPPLTSTLRRLGLSFPRVSLVEAITFGHVIAAREPMPLPLLFHELVHVVQFRLLGVPRFTWLYARGLLEGGSYESIPLERCAFELEERYRRGEAGFSVEMEVLSWIRERRF